jgi:hypothetical protein
MLRHFFIWISLVIVLVLILGFALSHRSGQVPVSLKGHQTARLILSESFDHATALSRFRVGQPDLGFKAGDDQHPAWRIEEGRLVPHKAHNATLWLTQPLPAGDLRISFTARALSKEGDVKCEISGDGVHHQSGYILINGGWKNTIRAIARQDEHGEDRREDRRCGKKRQCVPLNKDVTWVIERRDHILTWYLDGRLVLRYEDPHPLTGHHFGFGNWSSGVQFDNLRIDQLSAHAEVK